jgi:ribonuclease HI
MMQKETIIIYTDGGSRSNPGPAAIGVWSPQLDIAVGEYIGKATNNEAEYRAIIAALSYAKKKLGKGNAKEAQIEIRSDSQLIVEQLNGNYKVKEETLFKWFVEVWNRMQEFASVTMVHIPREKNKEADRLVNEALDVNKEKATLL